MHNERKETKPVLKTTWRTCEKHFFWWNCLTRLQTIYIVYVHIYIYIYIYNMYTYIYIYTYTRRSMTLDDLWISSQLPMAQHDLPGRICQSFSGNFAKTKLGGTLPWRNPSARNAMPWRFPRRWKRKNTCAAGLCVCVCVCVCVFCLLRFNTRRGFHTQWQTNLSKMTGDQVGELGHMRPWIHRDLYIIHPVVWVWLPGKDRGPSSPTYQGMTILSWKKREFGCTSFFDSNQQDSRTLGFFVVPSSPWVFSWILFRINTLPWKLLILNITPCKRRIIYQTSICRLRPLVFLLYLLFYRGKHFNPKHIQDGELRKRFDKSKTLKQNMESTNLKEMYKETAKSETVMGNYGYPPKANHPRKWGLIKG